MHSRIFLAVVAGSAATLGILFGMSVLIDFGHAVEIEPRERDELVFLRELREPPPPPEEQPPARLPEPPPIPQTILPAEEAGTAPVRIALATPTPSGNWDSKVTLTADDGPLVAVLRVQPNYPTRAVAQGLEGYVVVEFTVTPDGSTAEHRVVESSHGLFEAAAIRAAERFRFRPRVIDGVPVSTRGIQNLFRFEMEQH